MKVWQGILFLMVVWFVLVSLVALWTQRSLEFWVNYAHNTSGELVSYGVSWVVSIPVPLMITGNFITEIARLILG